MVKTISQLIASIKATNNEIRRNRKIVRNSYNAYEIRSRALNIDILKSCIKHDIAWIRSIQRGA